MAARLSIFHKGLVLILSPILLETAVVLNLSSILSQVDKQQLQESYFRETSASVIKMSSLTFDACMYLFAMGLQSSITHEIFDNKVVELRAQTKSVEELFRGDPVFQPIFKDVIKVEFRTVDILEAIGKSMGRSPESALTQQVQSAIAEIVTMLSDTADLIDTFSTKNDQRIAESAKRISFLRRDYSVTLLIAVIGSLLLSIILLAYFQRSIIARLARIRKNTELLKEGKDLPKSLPGVDEIALLDQSFHLMQNSLKETRKKEELFFENAADVICILDKDFNFLRVNAAANTGWGATQQSLVGQPITCVITEDDRPVILAELNAARQSRDGTIFDAKVLRNFNNPVEFNWSIYHEPIEDRFFCIAHDISIRKQVERARERYVSIVSHDLKKPITSISDSYRALAEMSGLPVKASTKTLSVRNNLNRLLELVKELTQRKTFSDNEELNLSDFFIERLLEQSTSDIEDFARSKEISVVFESNDSLQTKIHGDFGRLMQVLVNLLSNAVKFSPKNGTVTLRGSVVHEHLEIEVVDQGRGIPLEMQNAIFEKYKQVTEADGKRSAGTGLGLPICKQIVEQHDGTIVVESKEGNGSTFRIHLPLTQKRQGSKIGDAGSPDGDSSSPVGKKVGKEEEEEEEEEESTLKGEGSVKTKKNAPTDEEKKQKIYLLHNVPLFRKGLILVGVPLVFEIALASFLTNFLLQSEALTSAQIHERLIVNACNQLTFCYRKMGIALLGQGTEEVLEDIYKKNITRTSALSKKLTNLVKDDKKRSETVARIKVEIRDCNRSLRECFHIKKREGLENPYTNITVVFKMMKPTGVLIRDLQDLITDAAKKEKRSPEKQRQLTQLQDTLLFGGLCANIIIGLILARLFSNDIRKRLEQVAENTRLLARDSALKAPIGGSDEIAVLDAAFHDAASELLQARKKERTLFDNSHQVICSFDPSGKMTSVNPAASKLWGYEKDELLNSSGFMDRILEEDREKTRQKLFEIQEGKSPIVFENRISAKDGSLHDTLWSVTRAEGETEIFCMVDDISRQKEADRVRNEFLSIISHDLRTPLSGVLMTTVMLQEGAYGELSTKASSMLSSVNSDVNRLLDLINDLLDMEKLEAGMMTLAYETVSLLDLPKELAVKCNNLLEEKNISLSVNSLGDEKLMVDKDRFLQAMANLLNNAIERSESGASIDLLADKTTEGISIIIRDHAPSIDERTREGIFNRFTITSSESSKTSSLAVPLSRSIIAVHGGTVTLTDTPDQISNEFVVSLPRR